MNILLDSHVNIIVKGIMIIMIIVIIYGYPCNYYDICYDNDKGKCIENYFFLLLL